jgi:hypothetical protein
VVAISPETLNGVHGASKAYVLALSHSLQHELGALWRSGDLGNLAYDLQVVGFALFGPGGERPVEKLGPHRNQGARARSV